MKVTLQKAQSEMSAMNHLAKRLVVSDEDRDILESWVSAHNTPQALVWRAQIVLHATEGMANTHIAESIGVTVVTVREWRKRFEAEGIGSLTQIKSGRGRKRVIDAAVASRPSHGALSRVRLRKQRSKVHHVGLYKDLLRHQGGALQRQQRTALTRYFTTHFREQFSRFELKVCAEDRTQRQTGT